MANPRQPRDRISRLLRRRIVGKAAAPMHGAGRALIVRWIGAAAVKRRREADRATRALPASDNVIPLAWAQTFGRDTSRQPRNADFSSEVLAMRPRIDLSCVSASV